MKLSPSIDAKRAYTVFTRHYQAALLLGEQEDLIVTMPTMTAQSLENNPKVVILDPPFDISPHAAQNGLEPYCSSTTPAIAGCAR